MTTAKLIAFHGDPKIKATYLKRVRAHAKADEIIHGTGWEDGKGCAVGCTLHKYEHSAYETELGIPATIAHLEDAIFEGLSNGKAKEFPARFLKAIKPGADLSLVTARFMVWMLSDPNDGVIRHTKGFPAVESAVTAITALYERVIAGGTVSNREWNNAEEAAEAAAWAAEAAAWAAEAAAWAAAEAARAAAEAARAVQWEKMADKLIELLEAA